MNTPNPSQTPGFDRRTLLRRGGLTLGLGAFLSACAADFGGDTAPGRVGLVESETMLPEGAVNDVVYLRTMQSLEHSVVELLTALTAAGHFTAPQQSYIDRFIADHIAASETIGEHIAEAGGESFACENRWVRSRFVDPVLSAANASDDSNRDARSAAHAFETMLAHSYQHLVGIAAEPAIRQGLITLGASAARRSALLAAQSNASEFGYFGPEINSDAPETDAEGFPVGYALPAVFGQVGQIQLVVGAVNDEGSRYATSLQTPAENTFVYDYMSC
jgi:hypothetical protein